MFLVCGVTLLHCNHWLSSPAACPVVWHLLYRCRGCRGALLAPQASLASLEETAPWMDTLHGPLILAITYVMAGAGAVLAPMLASSAATSIGGIGGSGRQGAPVRAVARLGRVTCTVAGEVDCAVAECMRSMTNLMVGTLEGRSVGSMAGRGHIGGLQ